jgi:hypothetical protein
MFIALNSQSLEFFFSSKLELSAVSNIQHWQVEQQISKAKSFDNRDKQCECQALSFA